MPASAQLVSRSSWTSRRFADVEALEGGELEEARTHPDAGVGGGLHRSTVEGELPAVGRGGSVEAGHVAVPAGRGGSGLAGHRAHRVVRAEAVVVEDQPAPVGAGQVVEQRALVLPRCRVDAVIGPPGAGEDELPLAVAGDGHPGRAEQVHHQAGRAAQTVLVTLLGVARPPQPVDGRVVRTQDERLRVDGGALAVGDLDDLRVGLVARGDCSHQVDVVSVERVGPEARRAAGVPVDGVRLDQHTAAGVVLDPLRGVDAGHEPQPEPDVGVLCQRVVDGREVVDAGARLDGVPRQLHRPEVGVRDGAER